MPFWTKPTGRVSTLSLRLWEFTGTALVNLLIGLIVLGYLLPLAYMFITSLKEKRQFLDPAAPLYPARQVSYTYNDQEYLVYQVPTDQGVQEWALVQKSRRYSDFIDPAHPERGLIRWDGSWRQLRGTYQLYLTLDNYRNLWEWVKFPLLIGNTLVVAFWGELGVLASSIAVAYGFSRFRIPGGPYLFLLLIATIMIPDSITLVPTYMLFVKYLNWNGTWYPLIAPHLFGNAIFIFLLRQNFRSIPRDLDEAAMLDGAGPLRILTSIILPQRLPVVVTIALLHFFYAWNELRLASLYLGIAPQLRTISFGIQSFQGLAPTPEMLEASALLVVIVPAVVLFVTQRFFMQDMVVTGLEK